jgi:hypothetical protein
VGQHPDMAELIWATKTGFEIDGLNVIAREETCTPMSLEVLADFSFAPSELAHLFTANPRLRRGL